MKMAMESWVLMSLHGRWRIRYVIMCSCFFCTRCIWTKALVLAKTCSRVSCRLLRISLFHIYHRTFHVCWLHFSGYRKANDARRLILDIANDRWPLTHLIRPNHSADQSFTHISMTLLVALTITRMTILTFVIYSSSTTTTSGFPLSLWNLTLRALLLYPEAEGTAN